MIILLMNDDIKNEEKEDKKRSWEGIFMGWRMRKSIGIGKFFRVNLSKSGVGFSVGVPGCRVSVGPDKKVRRTVGIPWMGIYNTEVVGGRTIKKRRTCPQCDSPVTLKANFCSNCGAKLK
ncbi:DUF4236 domain-containing protein [Thermoanaerobacteraceae bacterium SP2]|nr:DUF4236 domain-containing protein [Thermoanaerobacteraceae bacterium SP2]